MNIILNAEGKIKGDTRLKLQMHTLNRPGLVKNETTTQKANEAIEWVETNMPVRDYEKELVVDLAVVKASQKRPPIPLTLFQERPSVSLTLLQERPSVSLTLLQEEDEGYRVEDLLGNVHLGNVHLGNVDLEIAVLLQSRVSRKGKKLKEK